jgi:hypothetical protein
VEKIIVKKRRRIRIDPNNPYRTRDIFYSLLERERELIIEVEQYDYVLHSLVAEDRKTIQVEEKWACARQLIDYMLKHVNEVGEAIEIYWDWLNGKITLINDCKSVLVKEAVRKRFARNLKKM